MAMNKSTFMKNLNELVVTDDMTVQEAKTINRKKRALVNKVKKLIVEQVRIESNKSLSEQSGYYFVFPNFKLKPSGKIKVEVMFNHSGWGDFGTIGWADELAFKSSIDMKAILK